MGLEGGIEGELGEGHQKVQTSSYKLNKFWRYNVQHDDYNNTVLST